MNYQKILDEASHQLNLNNIKTPKLDSELILAKTLDVDRENILLNLNKEIKKSLLKKFNYYLNLRKKKNTHSTHFKL